MSLPTPRSFPFTAMAIVASLVIAVPIASSGELLLRELQTDLVPGPIEYAVLTPDGYSDSREPYPLFWLLHGGGSDRSYLRYLKPQIEELWAADRLSPFVAVCASVRTGTNYLDDIDGREKWETFLVQEFLPHIRETYNLSDARERTVISQSFADFWRLHNVNFWRRQSHCCRRLHIQL